MILLARSDWMNIRCRSVVILLFRTPVVYVSIVYNGITVEWSWGHEHRRDLDLLLYSKSRDLCLKIIDFYQTKSLALPQAVLDYLDSMAATDIVTKRIHVGGLTPSITPAHIQDRFKSFGTVLDVEELKADALGESAVFWRVTQLNLLGQPRPFTFFTIQTTRAQLVKCKLMFVEDAPTADRQVWISCLVQCGEDVSFVWQKLSPASIFGKLLGQQCWNELMVVWRRRGTQRKNLSMTDWERGRGEQ